MASSFRTNLLKHEMARREEVISAAEKLTPGKGDAFRRMYQKGDLQRRCAAKILSEETGKLPLVSADFQHWYEDLHVWKIAFNTAEGFHWKRPLMFSNTGYSRTYLEAFYDQNETEDEKTAREERARSLEEKWAGMRSKGLASTDPIGPVQSHSGTVIAPEHVEEEGGCNVPLEDKVRLWKELFGESRWEDGYAPMEIYVPENIDVEVVLGPISDLPSTMTSAWLILGGRDPWPIRLYTRLWKDPKSGIRASLFIDWIQGQDLSDPYWKQGVYIAVVTLFDLFYQWLRGKPVNLTEWLQRPIEARMKPHGAVFENIGTRNMTIRDQALRRDKEAAMIEGEKTRVENLLRKQHDTVIDIFYSDVQNKMNKAQSRDERLQILVKIVDEGLRPLPLTLAERREHVEGFAMGLFTNMLRARLSEDNMDLNNVLFDLHELFTDRDTLWAKLLLRGHLYQVIDEFLNEVDYKLPGLNEEARSGIASALSRWAKYKDELEWEPESELAKAASSLKIS